MNRRFKGAFGILVLTILLTLVSGAHSSAQITVAVASSTQSAVMKIIAIYTIENPGVSVNIVAGSTGKLTNQIENGAPYHIFMAADSQYPKYLSDQGLTITMPKTYAHGSLIYWSMDKNADTGDWKKALSGTDKIAIASPRKAPYGRLAKEVLEREGFFELYEQRLVIGASVSQLNQFMLSGSIKTCMTAKSAVFLRATKNTGYWIDIENSALAQQAVLTKHAEKDQTAQAQSFFDFLFSEKAMTVFQSMGFDN